MPRRPGRSSPDTRSDVLRAAPSSSAAAERPGGRAAAAGLAAAGVVAAAGAATPPSRAPSGAATPPPSAVRRRRGRGGCGGCGGCGCGSGSGSGCRLAPAVRGRRLHAGPGVPGQAVEAAPPARGLALGLVHDGRRQPEDDRDLGEHALGHLAQVPVAREAGPGDGAQDGVALAHLQGLERGHGGESGGRRGDVAEQLGRRAERAEEVRHVDPAVLAQERLAHLEARGRSPVTGSPPPAGRPPRRGCSSSAGLRAAPPAAARRPRRAAGPRRSRRPRPADVADDQVVTAPEMSCGAPDRPVGPTVATGRRLPPPCADICNGPRIHDDPIPLPSRAAVGRPARRRDGVPVRCRPTMARMVGPGAGTGDRGAGGGVGLDGRGLSGTRPRATGTDRPSARDGPCGTASPT